MGSTSEGAASSADAVIVAALTGRDDDVARALEREPRLPQSSISVAVAVADRAAAAALLDEDAGCARRAGGPWMWPPLLYLCCSRYGRDRPPVAAARAAIARHLIELGADPNATGREPGFADKQWQPLSGAAHCAANAELVSALVVAGASAMKTDSLLNHAVGGGSLAVLARLLQGAPPDWYQIGWALLECVERDRGDMARVLIEHASGSAIGSTAIARNALHAAIRRHCGPETIDVLLGQDSTGLGRAVRQALYRDAVRHAHESAAALLEARGVSPQAARDVDRAIGACLDGDVARARAVAASVRLAETRLQHDDHRMLAWAIRSGRLPAVPLLLDLGLDPNVPDADGDTPLHLAVRDGALDLVDLLLRRGGSLQTRNFDGDTAPAVARDLPEGAIRDAIVSRLSAAGPTDPNDGDAPPAGEDRDVLFERAADAVASGDLETLRELLDRAAVLVHARSPRPHRCTLLNYCAANGVEAFRQRAPANAPAIAQVLLDRGADPNAVCNLYGGAQTTMGLMLTSAHPAAAGLDGELTRVLLHAGARLDTGELMGAIEYGLTRAVAAFAEYGAPVDTLFVAAGLDRVDSMEALVAAGADVDEQFEAGGFGTALHAAAAMGHTRAARWLLDRGADATLRNRWEATPLETAGHFERHDAVELFREQRRL